MSFGSKHALPPRRGSLPISQSHAGKICGKGLKIKLLYRTLVWAFERKKHNPAVNVIEIPLQLYTKQTLATQIPFIKVTAWPVAGKISALFY
jgi:hypothetical protein